MTRPEPCDRDGGRAVSAGAPLSAALDRVAYRQSRARRSTLVALVSTVVFAAVVCCRRHSTPGWPRVRDRSSILRVGWETLPARWRAVAQRPGAGGRQVAILILGLAVPAVRTLRGPVWFPLRALATGYVDLFRGVPLLIAST